MARQHYDYLLSELRDDLLSLGNMVEQALEQASASLSKWDSITAEQVIKGDIAIDATRRAIEDAAMALLATQQPVARDLRLMNVVMAIATELERVGDYAKGIATRVKEASGHAVRVAPPAGVYEMAALARQMVHTSLEALLRYDSALARSLAHEDDRVDALRSTLRAELLDLARADPQQIDGVIDLLDVVHVLERVADRATNIGERVIYLVESSTEELNP